MYRLGTRFGSRKAEKSGPSGDVKRKGQGVSKTEGLKGPHSRIMYCGDERVLCSCRTIIGAVRQAQAQSAPGADCWHESTRHQPRGRTRATPGCRCQCRCRWHEHGKRPAPRPRHETPKDRSHQIQRPAAGIVNRTAGQFNTPGGGGGGGGLPLPLWSQSLQQQLPQQHISPQNVPPPVRQPFIASERSLDTSERSNTAQEVEELLGSQGRMQRRTHYQGGWASSTNQAQQQQQQQQRGKSSNFFWLM
ncbi:hypothetical protein V8E52_000246 [Russula decolorans]|jgi:hypothetical protein